MERVIKLQDLERAVAEAYESVKSEKEGKIDERVSDANPKDLGIAVALTDGSMIQKGDVAAPFCLGNLARLVIAPVLLSQNTPDEIAKKAANGACCKAMKDRPELPLPAMLLRAVSMIEPTGDADGKWNIILDMFNALTTGEPVLNDKAYKAQKELNAKADLLNKLAASGFNLYDDAADAVEVLTKLLTMQLNTAQLATLGATIAADGVNVVTNVPAFDGNRAANVVGMMAASTPCKLWMFKHGTPAAAGFGGGFLAVVPGVMAIAAYSPELNANGISAKAAQAVAAILDKLEVNALSSAKLRIEK